MPADYSKELALFLEKVRFLREISQEDFTEGIISNRQYQRYVKGDSPMPFHLINLFAEKLNLTKEVLLLEFENDSVKETFNISSFLSAVINNDQKQIDLYKSKINTEYIHQPENKTLFEFALCLDKLYKNTISIIQFKDMCLELIDFEKTISRTSLNLNESLILVHLLGKKSQKDDLLIINKIEQFLSNPTLIWTGNQTTTLNIIFFTLAKYFGKDKNYEKTIFYSNKGIDLNIKTKSNYDLDNYYYFLALSYFRLNNMEMFELNIYKCYCALVITENQSRIDYYTQIIKKDFNIELKSFIVKYLSK